MYKRQDHERLIHRPKPGLDQAMPSGNAVAATVLGRLAALTGEEKYALAARRTVALFYPAMCERPAGFAAMAVALDEQLDAPRTLVLRGERSDLLTRDTALAMARRGPRAKVVEIAGVGHAPTLMQREQIAIVQDFLLQEGAST